jgi:hypothetical protein
VDISAALSEDLAALSDAAGGEYHVALAQLGRGLQVAVPSYLGLSITLVTFGQPITFTAARRGSDAIDVQASLHFPVALLTESDPSSTLTVYAAVAGAFADLAADLGWLADTDGSMVLLDQHLVPESDDDDGALTDFALINQAAGVLIAAGFAVEDAYLEIAARAERAGIARAEAAREIVRAVSDGG